MGRTWEDNRGSKKLPAILDLNRGTTVSRKNMTATLFLLFGIGSAVAQNSCAARAMSEDGKPLAGPARTSFMKSCCEHSARDKEGKPLEGQARAMYVEMCRGSLSAPAERG